MTPPRYSPTVQDADDPTVKETLHCIATMEAYKHKSQEELRFDDYASGRGGINTPGHRGINTPGRGGINTPHLLALPRDNFFDMKPNTKPVSYSPTSSPDEQGAYMHAITHMQAYRNMSFEELRLKDYRDGRGPPNCTIKQVILPQPPESLHTQLLTHIEEGSVPSHLMEWYKGIVTLVGRGSTPEARDACISKMEAMDARNTPVYAFLSIVLGTILRESSDLGKAVFMFQQAVTIRIHNFGEENSLVARALLELAAALARRGKCDEALFATKRAALILASLQETSLLARAYMDRAVLEQEMGEDSDASMSFLKVVDIAADLSGVNSNSVNFARDKLLDHYHKKGDYARLASLLEKIDEYVKKEEQARLAQAQEPAPDLAALAIHDILRAVPAPCLFKFSIASPGVKLDGTRTFALIPIFSVFNPSMLLSETRVQCYQRVALQFSYLRDITVGFTIHNPPDLPQYDPFGPNNGYFLSHLEEVSTKSIFFYFKPDGGLYYGYGTIEKGCLRKGLPNVEMTAVVILWNTSECMVKLTAFDSSNEANNNNIDWNAIKFLSATEQANQNSPIGNQSRTAGINQNQPTNQNSANGNQSTSSGANQVLNQTNQSSTNQNQTTTVRTNQPSSSNQSRCTGALCLQQQCGTAHVKYSPATEPDVVVIRGFTQSVNIKLHCITCMKEYKNKSLEELRHEDYLGGRKGAAQLFGATCNTTVGRGLGGFGNTSALGGSTLGGCAATANNSTLGASSGSSSDEDILSRSLAELLSEDLSLASPLGFHPKMEQHVKIDQGVVTLQLRRSTYVFSLLPAMINQVYTIKGLNAKKDGAKVLQIGFTTADPDRLELSELPVLTDELSFRHDSWQFDSFNMPSGNVMLKLKSGGEVLVAQNKMGRRPLRTPPHQNIWLFIHADGVVSRFQVDTLCRELSDAILTTDSTVASPQTRPLSAQTNAISTPQNRTSPATQNTTPSTQNRTSPATQNRTRPSQNSSASTSEDANNLCKICLNNEVNATLLDCGHCLCFECATVIKRDKGICPICRQVIRQVFKLFMS